MKPEPRVVRKLVRSWLIQGIGWYALTEVVARLALESGFVIVLWALRLDLLRIVVWWLAFHTLVWFFLYGGFMRAWIVLGFATDVRRLQQFRDAVTEKVCRRRFARVVFLRGSAARDELNPRSDIDICVVPQPTMAAKFGGVLFWWGLRVESVARLKPLEARWIDAERYIPYHVIDETPRILKQPDPKPRWNERLASRGILVAMSGIDGSGKTSAAENLVKDLRRRGIEARYFYGHRQPWYKPTKGPGLSFAILYESLWKRIGRTMEEWEHHGMARTVYQLLTILDYLDVRRRLVQQLRRPAVVVADRYVADVIAYMRSWGPLLVTLEGLFIGLNPPPDLAMFFELTPEQALARKREWALPRLRIFVREYERLRTLLSLVRIDASHSAEEVYAAILKTVELGLGPVPNWTRQPNP